MKSNVSFRELRQLLLALGFKEVSGPRQTVFRHEPSDTLFVFRAYRPSDPVANYNLIEVQNMLDARGFLPAEAFADQFRKAPA